MAEPLVSISGLGYRYPEAESDSLIDVELEIEPGELIVLAGRSGSGKTTLLRACCGLVPHYHGGDVHGEVRVAGLDVREHGPAELGGAVGLVAQDPETQVVSTTVRAELELPLEIRGEPPAARARAVEEVALALAMPAPPGTARRHPLRRRAAAGRARRRAGRAPAAGAARRADLAARPGGGRRARRASAAAERGVGDGGRPRRASPRALPRRRRPCARDGRRADRVRRQPAGSVCAGRSSTTRPWRPPARACSSWPGSASRRSGSRTRAAPCAPSVSSSREAAPAHPAQNGSGPAGGPAALELRNAWVELDDGSGPRDVLRGVDLKIAPRRAGRADGPERRRQDHPPPRRGRKARSRRAGAPRRRPAARSARRAPATSSFASGSATSYPAMPGGPRSTPPGSIGPRTRTRVTCRGASASGWPWRS